MRNVRSERQSEEGAKMNKSDEHTTDVKNDFSKGSVKSAILRLALPMTAAQMINILYSIVDRIYLGRIEGSGMLALTGVGVVMPVITIVMSFCSLCSMGGSSLCSISRGKGDNDEAERIMGNSFALLLMFGVVLTAVVLIFKRPILYLFGASDATFPFANDYLTIYICGTLFVMLGLGMNPFVNSQGFAKTGMLTVALGAVVNIILDPIFIFALGLDVRGAALATIIAQACSAVWVLRFLTGRRAILRLRVSAMKLELRRCGRILSLGLAGLVANLTTSLSQIVCNSTLQKYGGDTYVGVMTVINSLREVVFMPVQGLCNGSAPVMGFNFGAKKPDRVRQGIRFSGTVAVAYSFVVWAVVMLIPGPLIRIFNNDAGLLEAGIPAMRIFYCLFFMMALHFSSQVVFQSLGIYKKAMFFSLLRKALIGVPLTLLLPAIGLGTNGVFIAEAASQLISGIACFTAMYFTVYKRLGNGTLVSGGK